MPCKIVKSLKRTKNPISFVAIRFHDFLKYMFLFSTSFTHKNPLFCSQYLTWNMTQLLETLLCVLLCVFVTILIADFESRNQIA